MPVAKLYNETSGQWEAVLVGRQGDPGVAGVAGDPGVVKSSTPPENIDVIWFDPEDPADPIVIPPAGQTGQVLAKASNDDFDTEWVDVDLSTIESDISNIQSELLDKKTEISLAVSSNITAEAGYRYFVDTSAARTITLPSTPNLGDEIQFFDSTNSAGTNKITINRNGEKINGQELNAELDVDAVAAVFVYTGSTYGWRLG